MTEISFAEFKATIEAKRKTVIAHLKKARKLAVAGKKVEELGLALSAAAVSAKEICDLYQRATEIAPPSTAFRCKHLIEVLINKLLGDRVITNVLEDIDAALADAKTNEYQAVDDFDIQAAIVQDDDAHYVEICFCAWLGSYPEQKVTEVINFEVDTEEIEDDPQSIDELKQRIQAQFEEWKSDIVTAYWAAPRDADDDDELLTIQLRD